MSFRSFPRQICIGPEGKTYAKVTAVLERSRAMGLQRIKSGIKIENEKYHAIVANMVHENAHRIFEATSLPHLPPLALQKLDQIRIWKNQYGVSLLYEPERRFFSNMGYAGTPDLTCALQEQNYAIDIKTGVNLREYDLTQIEVYGHLLDENFPGMSFRRAILQVFADSFQFYQFEPDAKRRTKFMNLLAKWKTKYQI